MKITRKTKVTWPLLLGIIIFGGLAMTLKNYLNIQNNPLWYAGAGATAVLIIAIINKIKN